MGLEAWLWFLMVSFWDGFDCNLMDIAFVMRSYWGFSYWGFACWGLDAFDPEIECIFRMLMGSL